MARGIVGLVLAFAAAGVARGEEWRTPDGVASVARPDPARFVAVGADPPALVVWELPDGTMRMLVWEMPAPPGVTLAKGHIEKGFLREVNANFADAELVASEVEARDGREVFTMTAKARDDAGVPVYCTQAITLAGAKAYKVMVFGAGKDTRADPDAAAFVASFRVVAGVPAAAPPAAAAPNQKPAVNDVAYNAGRIAGMCLFVAGVLWVIRRVSRGG